MINNIFFNILNIIYQFLNKQERHAWSLVNREFKLVYCYNMKIQQFSFVIESSYKRSLKKYYDNIPDDILVRRLKSRPNVRKLYFVIWFKPD